MTPQNRARTLFVGGASGISKAVARLLLEAGGAIVLLGRQRAKLDAGQRELAQIGRVDIEVLDITDAAAVRAFATRVPDEFSDLSGLVNGASVFVPKPFLDHLEEDYDRYLELNRGTFFLTQAVAKAMVARGEGARSSTSDRCGRSRRSRRPRPRPIRWRRPACIR
jgi:NAD(P)-dependent dehydrogenase (short-subunit alcohol dehydrogenase family)